MRVEIKHDIDPEGLKKRLRFLTLAIVMSVVVGCATGGAPKPGPGDNKPSVTRSEDGGAGFTIREVSTMDEDTRNEFNQGVSLLKNKDYEGAIARFQSVIDTSPGVTAPYVNMAMAYRESGQPEKAEDFLKSALEIFPDHPVVCNEYGLLYRKTGRFAEAKAMYEKALEKFPEYYPLHLNIGIVCDLYLNDPACALTHYEIYSKAKPDDKKVKIWIAGLRMALENK